jgi:hypothetical protein
MQNHLLKQINILVLLYLCGGKGFQSIQINDARPINYWSFNGNYNDQIGAGNPTGGLNFSLTTDRFGNLNSAVDLSSGYLNLPNITFVNGSFSLLGWIYPTKLTSLHFLVSFARGWGDAVTSLAMWDNDRLLSLHNGGLVYSNIAFPLKCWSHIAQTVDSSGMSILYINGSVVAGPSNMGVAPSAIRNYNYIGTSTEYGKPNGNAFYDDIKIFNFALTSNQIVADFNSPNPGPATTLPPTSTSTTSTTTPAPPLPINYWSFNGNYNDQIGAGNPTSGLNFSLTTDRFGNLNSAVDLSSGYLNLPNITFVNGSFSLLGWIYPTKLTSLHFLVSFARGWGDAVTSLAMWDNDRLLSLHNGGLVYSNIAFPLKCWSHIAQTVDSSGMSILYINGSVVAGPSNMGVAPSAIRNYNYIGTSTEYGKPNGNAFYDDIKIFNFALTSNQIVADFNSPNPGPATTLPPTSTSTTSTTTPAPPLPINYWSFNGNYNDQIGAGNPTSGLNFSLTTDRFGNLNSAVDLSSGYLNLPNITFVNGSFSLLGWIYPTKLTSLHFLVSFARGNGDAVTSLAMWDNDRLLSLHNGGLVYSNIAFPLKCWSHIAQTVDSSGMSILYINGSVVAGPSNMGVAPSAIRNYNYIGTSTEYGKPNGNAFYDDIKIFNFALTSNQIVADFNSPNPGPATTLPPTSTSTTSTTTPAPPLPINYWSFNGNYNDQIGAGNPTSGLNFSLTTDRFGNLNSAVDLSSGYLNLPNITFVNGSFSLLGWIYPTKLTSLHFLVSFARGNGDAVTSLAMWDNDRLLSLHNGGLVYSNIAFPLKCWSHIAQTVDSSGMSILYINGSVVAGPSNMGVAPSAIRNYNYIGTSTEYGKPNGNAFYDDIKIFNFALTSNQIVADFNSPNPGPATTLPPTSTSTTSTTTPAPPLPINYWSFNGNYNDQIGAGNPTSGLNFSLTTDRFGNLNSAVDLSSGYLNLPNITFVNGSFSLLGWIYPTKLTSLHFLVSFARGNGDAVTSLAMWDNDRLLSLHNGGLVYSNIAFPLKCWSHIAQTVDSSGMSILYINGSVVAGPSNMGVAPSAIRNYNYIGTSTEYGKPNGNAFYDDIKIFNFALTSNQIVADFNSPNPGPATTLPPTSTSTTSTTTPAPPLPINYWSFNGNYNDQIGAGNPTSGLNFSLTTDRFGNLNSAVDLSSGYLNLPNITFVNGSFSLLGWIYPTKLTSLHFLVSFARGWGDAVTSLAMWDNDRLLSLHNGGLVYSNIAFPLKCWSHIAQTVDSSGMSILYINGSVVAGPSNMGVAPSAIRNYNYIGTSTEYGKPNGNAFYDDIKIFNFALTSNQIVADFNSPNPGPATTLPPTSTSTTSISTKISILKLNFIMPVNEWSFDNNLKDPISGLSIIGGINYKYVNDRSNNLNKAAIRLSRGYLQLPAGHYFSNTVFTITVWVNFISFDSKNEFTTIIDFGNFNQQDSVFLATSPVSNQILAGIFENTLQSNSLFSKYSLNLNTWYHVAYIYNGINGYIYLNGNLVASASQFSPFNINRENCYIGKSNLNSSSSLADAIYDDLRIYDEALTNDQIKYDMNNIPIPKPLNSNLNFTYSHLGCYMDNFRRDLNGLYFDMTLDNSPQACMNKCNQYNFKYAGVQYNYQCWCGKTFGNFGRAHNCYMTCPNNTVDLCGGAWSNDIYEIIPDKKSEPILMKSPVSSLILNTTVTSICENQQFEFNCPNGYVISVSYAMFGRISITKCQYGNYRYDKCNLIQTDAVGNACNNLNSCKFKIIDIYELKNDPCPGYSKYMDISLGCTLPN